MAHWNTLLLVITPQAADTSDGAQYRRANLAVVRDTIRGVGPHSGMARSDAGARVVYNVSSLYVPALLQDQYKNAYDLAPSRPAPGPASMRARIDAAIAAVAGAPEASLYYGAVEINGAGMRYYGDVCLVLKPGVIDSATLVLYRNSYDLACEPIRNRAGLANAAALQSEARDLAGGWQQDLPDMAACKVLHAANLVERRLTTGSVSDGVLSDEDYLEVVREKTFRASDIEEARVSAADTGLDGRIGDRLEHGPTPSLAELQWRQRRRRADRMLASLGLRTRTVVTGGRARS